MWDCVAEPEPMPDEEVVVAETLDDDGREYPRESGGGLASIPIIGAMFLFPRRLTAGPIIAAVVILLILGVVGFYFFYGAGEVNDVVIVQPEARDTNEDGNIDSLWFEVHVTPRGVRSFEGEGTLDIVYDGKSEYTSDVKISSDRALVEVPFDRFVNGGGDYDLRFSVAGKTDTEVYHVNFVAEEVEFDTFKTTYMSEEVVNISMEPKFMNLERFPVISQINKHFRFIVNMVGPEGEVYSDTYTMRDLNPDNHRVSATLDFSNMGNHTISVEMENLLVKASSEYRTIDGGEKVRFLNRPPEIEVSYQPQKVRPGTEVTFSLTGADPDENGRVEYYTIIWGDLPEDDPDVLQTVNSTGTTTEVKHVFDSIGTFEIRFSAADNGPFYQDGEGYHFLYEISETEIIDVEVKYLGR